MRQPGPSGNSSKRTLSRWALRLLGPAGGPHRRPAIGGCETHSRHGNHCRDVVLPRAPRPCEQAIKRDFGVDAAQIRRVLGLWQVGLEPAYSTLFTERAGWH